MDTRSAGGVLLAFCGVVLLIAGFRGTLGKMKDALLGDAGGATPAPAAGGGTGTHVFNAAPPSINFSSTLGSRGIQAAAQSVGINPPAGYAGTGNLAFNPFHTAPQS